MSIQNGHPTIAATFNWTNSLSKNGTVFAEAPTASIQVDAINVERSYAASALDLDTRPIRFRMAQYTSLVIQPVSAGFSPVARSMGTLSRRSIVPVDDGALHHADD